MRSRTVAIALALLGIAFAAFVEYGTTRAPDIERSFALFVFEAGPWALLLVLAMLSPYACAMATIGVILLALDFYAYYVVFIAPQNDTSAVIYLYKPLQGLALVAMGMLAGFLIARPSVPKA
jgi:hypothetical protein